MASHCLLLVKTRSTPFLPLLFPICTEHTRYKSNLSRGKNILKMREVPKDFHRNWCPPRGTAGTFITIEWELTRIRKLFLDDRKVLRRQSPMKGCDRSRQRGSAVMFVVLLPHKLLPCVRFSNEYMTVGCLGTTPGCLSKVSEQAILVTTGPRLKF